jgi:hypothetical protein
MKKLTRTQLKKIATMHAGALIMATEPMIAFSESNLSRSELSTLQIHFENISNRLLNGSTPRFDANEIVKYVRENRK